MITNHFLGINFYLMSFNQIKKIIPAILWAGMIFYFSSIPDLRSGLPDIFDIVLRKIAHAGEFGILAILIARGLGVNNKKTYLKAAFAAILYAVSDEIHQSFVPGRVASPIDISIDSFGAILGLIIFFKYKIITAK